MAPCSHLFVLVGRCSSHRASASYRESPVHLCMVVSRIIAMVDGSGDRRVQRISERLDASERHLAIEVAGVVCRNASVPSHPSQRQPGAFRAQSCRAVHALGPIVRHISRSWGSASPAQIRYWGTRIPSSPGFGCLIGLTVLYAIPPPGTRPDLWVWTRADDEVFERVRHQSARRILSTPLSVFCPWTVPNWHRKGSKAGEGVSAELCDLLARVGLSGARRSLAKAMWKQPSRTDCLFRQFLGVAS